MPALIVPFTKMNGAGNDFIVLDNRFLAFSLEELSGLAARLCPRRVGIGADGLLAVDEPDSEDTHFRMRYWNADGSLATMCGNGARCLSAFALDAGLGSGDEIVFDTEPVSGQAGSDRYRAERTGNPEVPIRLHLPPPGELEEVELDDSSVHDGRAILSLWAGTEHAVIFSDAVEAEDPEKHGAAIRNDAAFEPTGTNVNFVEVKGKDAIRVRTFEKGVEAETLACGTGAVASALVARLTGKVQDDEIRVHMPGGTLTVGAQIDENGAHSVTLAGPVERVYEGTFELVASGKGQVASSRT